MSEKPGAVQNGQGDTVAAQGGNDIVLGGIGNDSLAGGDGDDFLDGGDGNDTLGAGAGDDTLQGGAGNDTFRLDLSGGSQGEDVIADFTRGVDTLLVRQVDVETSDGGTNGTASDDPAAVPDDFRIADLDETSGYSIEESDGGNVVLVTPGGRTELAGVAYGPDTDSYSELENVFTVLPTTFGTSDADQLTGDTRENVIDGGDGNDEIRGGDGDDLLIGGAGNDLLASEGGDDELRGDEGRDVFEFDPSNDDEGSDVITDFDPAQDLIYIDAANIGVGSGGTSGEEIAAILDASSSTWGFESEAGGTRIVHPGGDILLEGVDLGANASFANLFDQGVLVFERPDLDQLGTDGGGGTSGDGTSGEGTSGGGTSGDGTSGGGTSGGGTSGGGTSSGGTSGGGTSGGTTASGAAGDDDTLIDTRGAPRRDDDDRDGDALSGSGSGAVDDGGRTVDDGSETVPFDDPVVAGDADLMLA